MEGRKEGKVERRKPGSEVFVNTCFANRETLSGIKTILISATFL